MADPIKHITIVGGGTAGWFTANMLSVFFGMQKNHPANRMRITLIESPNIPTVGVGEATVPSMSLSLQQTGISETEFFKTCNASFKLGVDFAGWNVDAKGKPFSYINPFNTGHRVGGIDPGYYYGRFGGSGASFVQTISPAQDLGLMRKGPRPLGSKPFTEPVNYAYHLDAGLFAKMMQGISVARGVEHVLDDMVDVERAEDGSIAAINLKETGRHEVELVIDCTGFKGLLINGALDEPFISYDKYLANDRAMAVQIPHPEQTANGPKFIEPVTRSTALGAGWSWRVPLFNRIGTGYVYSSAHRSDDEARDEFLKHLGDAGKNAEPRVIPMRVGRTRNSWVKNCIAIGLSGGFIEPLESTAIYMIEMAVRWLIAYFPDNSYPDSLRKRYNEVASGLYDEVRDFICLHYALGNRTDSQYWIDAREELDVPDSLAQNLEVWKHAMPVMTDLKSQHLFSPEVYTAVLQGKRIYQMRDDWNAGLSLNLNRDMWRKHVSGQRHKISQFVKAMPDHVALLREIRGDTPAQETPSPLMGNMQGLPGQQAPLQQGSVPLPGLGTRKTPVIKTPIAPADAGDGNLL